METVTTHATVSLARSLDHATQSSFLTVAVALAFSKSARMTRAALGAPCAAVRFGRQARRVDRMSVGRRTGGALFSWLLLFWARKREVTRPPAGGRKPAVPRGLPSGAANPLAITRQLSDNATGFLPSQKRFSTAQLVDDELKRQNQKPKTNAIAISVITTITSNLSHQTL